MEGSLSLLETCFMVRRSARKDASRRHLVHLFGGRAFSPIADMGLHKAASVGRGERQPRAGFVWW